MGLFDRIKITDTRSTESIITEIKTEIQNLVKNSPDNQASLYTCGRIISDAISPIPIGVYKYKNGEKYKDRSDPRHYLLNRRPNKKMNAQVWRSRMIYQWVNSGNAFSIIHREEDSKSPMYGMPIELELTTNVDTTEIWQGTDGTPSYIMLDNDKKRTGKKIPFRDMIHLRGFGGDIFALNPLEVLSRQLDTTQLAYGVLLKHYKGEARPEMFLQADISNARTGKNLEDTIDEWEKKYKKKKFLGGFRRIPGVAKLIPWQVNLQESQVAEMIKLGKADVAALFGIPVFMLGDYDHAKFNNIEYLSRFFSSMTVRPNAHIWRSELTDKLVTDKEYAERVSIEFNLNAAIETDYTTKADYLSKMVQNGIVTTDYVAELESLPKPPTSGSGFISNNQMEFELYKENKELVNEKLRLEIDKLKSS
jgi:HK97 family phage portal protein